ncbi:MAG: bifunctional metallophosphatase/5'-nucleotidase [Cellulosilyticum sp.]|nr:bifunctional metallophosphatase/5'-nucleotidase [Cellulosilyticum sp.]
MRRISMREKLKGIRFIMLVMTAFIMVPLMLPGTNLNAATKETTIQIVATSDTHGSFYPWTYATDSERTDGGMTKIATVLKQLKAENPNTIYVDNGDTIQGNSNQIFFEKDEINPMFVALNNMGCATMTLGNHEFNYGIDTLEKNLSGLKNTTVLCGNVYKPSGERLGEAYKIVECAGVKVAIIGMVTPNIVNWDAGHLKGYKVTSPYDETKAAIKEIQSKKLADVIIASVHMGLDGEYGNDSAAELAKQCPELNAIIAGHAHSKIEQEIVNNIPITEPGSDAANVSVVTITLEDNKVKSTTTKLVSAKDAEADQEMDKLLKPYHEEALEDAYTVIGKLEGGSLIPDSVLPGVNQGQLEDNALVDLILNVQMYYAEKSGKIPEGAHHVSGAAIFSETANAQAGDIKRSDTSNIYKYDNTLKVLKMTGKELKEYMEWSAKYYNTFKEGDLNVSFDQDVRLYNYDMFAGVKYDVNISKEAGSRIENLTYTDGTAVKENDVIYLTVNNYRCDSVLLATLFKDNKNVELVYDNSSETVSTIRELIGTYIVDVKEGIIKPECDQNWKLTGYEIDSSKQAVMLDLLKEGKLTLPTSEDGRTPNIKGLTWADVEAAQKSEQKAA